MTLEDQQNIAGVGSAFVALGLAPLMTIALRNLRPLAERRWRTAFGISILVSWFVQNIYRSSVEMPINMQLARQRGDMMYDGVGGNAAILMAGWIFPTFSCMLLWCVWRLFVAPKHKKNEEKGA